MVVIGDVLGNLNLSGCDRSVLVVIGVNRLPLPPTPAEPPRRIPRAESLLKLELCAESLLKFCVETPLKLWRVS